jgi:hypothetical protein
MSKLLEERRLARQRSIAEKMYSDAATKTRGTSLNEPEVKDLKPTLIKDEPVKIASAEETMARNLNRGKQPTDVLDYGKLKQEFLQKQKLLDAEKLAGRMAQARNVARGVASKAGLGGLAAGLGAYSALSSDDASAATPDYKEAAVQGALGLGSALDPVGVVDAAAEVRRRLKASPEERADIRKEDYRGVLADRLGASDSDIEAMGYEDGGAIRKQLLKKLAGR